MLLAPMAGWEHLRRKGENPTSVSVRNTGGGFTTAVSGMQRHLYHVYY